MTAIKNTLSITYSLLSYTLGLSALLYFMAFLLNVWVPKTIDSGETVSLSLGIVSNSVYLLLYLTLHSVMARPWFKRWWIRLVPAYLERSTYVLISGLTLMGLIALWNPLPETLWEIHNPTGRWFIYGLNILGWAIMAMATFNIGHFAFFGLQQTMYRVLSRETPPSVFTSSYLYAVTRHPISLGWLMIFWATPNMTVGHLLMALWCSVYIFVVTPLEEADLTKELGEPYIAYRKQVRTFLPIPRRKKW